MIFLLYIIFCLYPVVFGIINALIYGRKGADSFKMDEHWIILLEIACVYIQVLMVNEFRGLFTEYEVRLVVFCTIISHPFLKQLGYFEARNLIDGSYKKGFRDDSTTSTAKVNFKWPVRLAFLIIAILILVAHVIYF